MLHVQTNGAVRAKDGNRNMLLVRTRVAYADECCMFGKLVQITWAAKRQGKSGNSKRYNEKSRKARARKKKEMKGKVCEEKGERCLRRN